MKRRASQDKGGQWKRAKTNELDLNKVLCAGWDDVGPEKPKPFPSYAKTTCKDDVKSVVSHIGKLSDALTAHVKESTAVVGCVAWLTHPGVLAELAKKKLVSIIVQKEDFLRPDSAAAGASASSFKTSLHKAYGAIQGIGGVMGHYDNVAFGLIEGMDAGIWCPPMHGETEWHAIRCAGAASAKNRQWRPNLHHKFLVFLRPGKEQWHVGTKSFNTKAEAESYAKDQKYAQDEIGRWSKLVPYAVWTGSFNITANGDKSRENAIFVESRELADFYLREWQFMLAASEPLNWTSEYVAPEHEMGRT